MRKPCSPLTLGRQFYNILCSLAISALHICYILKTQEWTQNTGCHFFSFWSRCLHGWPINSLGLACSIMECVLWLMWAIYCSRRLAAHRGEERRNIYWQPASLLTYRKCIKTRSWSCRIGLWACTSFVSFCAHVCSAKRFRWDLSHPLT